MAKFVSYRKSRKKYNTKRKRFKKKQWKRKKTTRSFPRVKTVNWNSRNVGGDRANAKLFFVASRSFTVAPSETSASLQFPMNAPHITASGQVSWINLFGNAPGARSLAGLYSNYRVRGVKLKFTYFPTVYAAPMVGFVDAQADASVITDTPSFPAPAIQTTGEQRWAKTKLINNPNQGGSPSSISVYYSVNKVQGPDNVVKNDMDYVGSTKFDAPFFDEVSVGSEFGPRRGPTVQFGIYPLVHPVPSPVTVQVKMEGTLYISYFSKIATVD